MERFKANGLCTALTGARDQSHTRQPQPILQLYHRQSGSEQRVQIQFHISCEPVCSDARLSDKIGQHVTQARRFIKVGLPDPSLQ